MKKYFPVGADLIVYKITGGMIAFMLFLLALAGGLTMLPLAVVIVMYSIAGLIAAILAVGWLIRPSRYEIGSDRIAIIRTLPFLPIVIPLSEIKEVRHLTIESLKPASIALPFVFGYAGRFRNDELGDFFISATGIKEAVLVATNDEKFILSPSNPRRFVKHVHDA
ncbi:MAG: PH domain-containing protein, partial [Armatimonadota bacterium]|nr:PH domain-containing protein [Armatimonadota bacterium]